MRRALAITAATAIMLCHGYASAELSSQDQADALFEQGVERFREGDFAGALEHFRGSYDASPTPALRFNIGVCHYNLGQWAEARTELTAYLSDTDPALITDERREQVGGMLAELNERLGPAPAEPEQSPTPPPPPQSPPETPEPSTADEVHEQSASDLQPESRRRISRAWFWVTAGLAAALAVGGGVTGGLVLGQEADFDVLVEECASGAHQGCYDDGVDIRDRADALVAATNALFATAGAFAVAAVVMAFFTDWSGEERLEAGNWRLAAGMSPSGLALDVSLSF